MTPDETLIREQLAATERANAQMLVEIKRLNEENSELREQVQELLAWQKWARSSVKERREAGGE